MSWGQKDGAAGDASSALPAAVRPGAGAGGGGWCTEDYEHLDKRLLPTVDKGQGTQEEGEGRVRHGDPRLRRRRL